MNPGVSSHPEAKRERESRATNPAVHTRTHTHTHTHTRTHTLQEKEHRVDKDRSETKPNYNTIITIPTSVS